MRDIEGLKFGKLTAISVDHKREYRRYWRCKCDCGNYCIVREDSLTTGGTRSCGCVGREKARLNNQGYKHGKSNTRIFRIWYGMKERCENPKRHEYQSYGGRGIKVCPEWENDFMVFYDWSMKNGYSDSLSIDRINNSKGYSPDNCRWADAHTQRINQRQHTYTYNGETKTLKEWSEIKGIKFDTLLYRYRKGWDAERALTEKPHTGNNQYRRAARYEESQGQIHD